MELIAQLTDQNVIAFLLLFVRISAILAFFPYFENQVFFVTAKASLAFYLTLIFYPLLPDVPYDTMTVEQFIIAILSEAMLGFIASIFLQLVIQTLHFAGQVVAFAMGFSLASSVDPVSGQQSPIIGQFLILVATMVLLAADMHHMILLFLHQTLLTVPLGGLVLSPDIIEYIILAGQKYFLIGFTLAFPISALIIFSDVIFGMIMKTNPQFNILVVGFPVKIMIGLVVIIMIYPPIMVQIKNEFMDAFNALQLFLR